MRAIRNITWFLVAFLLTVWAGIASAQTPEYFFEATVSGWPEYGRTGQIACQKANDRYHANGNGTKYALGPVVQAPNSNSFICYGLRPGKTDIEIGRAIRMACTASRPYYTDVGKTCSASPNPPPPDICKPGDVVDVTYKIGAVGRPAGSGYYPYWPKEPHDGQCSLNCTDAPKSKVRNAFERGGDDYASYTCEKTGNLKSNNEEGNAPAAPQEQTDPRKDVPPFDAPKGSCPAGTVNVGTNSDGVPRCQGTGTDPKNKPPAPPKVETEKTETAEDGTQTTTKTETVTNSDGSKTTTTTVTITRPDGTKQTDQTKDTSKTPNNTPGKDDSKQDDEKYDLCKQNPHLTICNNSTVSGSCGEIACTGDAIQCATLRAAAAMRCEQQSDQEALKASPLTAIGQAAINGTGLDSLPGPGNSQIVNLPSLEAQGWLGNGAAFADVTVTIQGQEVLVPLSKWSEYLLPFRFIMMIIASLISYRILSGAVIGS